MSKKITKQLFQSPLNWANATLSTNTMRVQRLSDSERKQLRVIVPQACTTDDDGDDTEVIDNDQDYVQLDAPLSRMTTMRLPEIHHTDLIGDWIGPLPVSSKFDEIEDGQYVTRMNTIDEDSDGESMKTIKRKAVDARLEEVNEAQKKTKGQGRLVQRYIFTWNNPTISGEEFKEFMEKTGAFSCVVFQKEEGEEGTPHFQGYVELNQRSYVSGVHKAVAPYKMSWQYANGTKVSNKKYCTKEDGRIDGPWYINEDKFNTAGQGRRSDMDKFALLVLENNGITEEVVDEMPGHAAQFGKNAQYLVNTLALQRAEKEEMEYWKEQARLRREGLAIQGQQQRHLELYFGPTAVGKTTQIKLEIIGERGERLYTKNCANKWWCGYDKHDVVLMDEFRGDSFGKMEDFNNVTNKGALQVETKGGNTVLLASEMHFASNRHPCHWWKKGSNGYYGWNDARFQAVARRFSKVHWWNDENELKILVNPGRTDDGSEGWAERNLEWRKFWTWNNRPVEEGDTVDTANQLGYFTLE